jgi:hypothetical protein
VGRLFLAVMRRYYFLAESLLASDGVEGVALDGAGVVDDGAGAVDDGGADGAVEAGGVAPVFGADGSFFWQAVSANAASRAAATRSVRFIVVLLSY